MALNTINYKSTHRHNFLTDSHFGLMLLFLLCFTCEDELRILSSSSSIHSSAVFAVEVTDLLKSEQSA